MILLASTGLHAQEPEDAGAQAAGAGQQPAASATEEIREQTIYIPYTKLREVFNKEGRGVFLPYEKFIALWKAAQEKTAPPPEPKPPVNAVIAEVESEAAVGKDVVRVTAKAKIELLSPGWNEVPLRLGDAVILSAKLGDEPARIRHEPGGYKLLVEKQGKEPAQYELTLEYAKAFSKAPGQNSVAFEAPQAPVNRWRIRIPETGVKVDIHPLIAASEVPEIAAGGGPPAETVVLAFVGAAQTVRFDWTPKAEGATGLAALATVQAQQEVLFDEGVIRTRANLAYEISRAELSQLTVEVPADQKVSSVFDPNVRQWEVKAGETTQTVTIQLFQPARGTQNVTLELEKFTGEAQQQELGVPIIKALGVGRQQGVVVVRLAPALRAEAIRRTGLMQLDAGELPQSLAAAQWAFAYRYASLPFDLALNVEKVQPRLQADELIEAYLEPEQLSLHLLALYNVERAGVFQFELDIPAGYDVRQVRGHAAAGAQPAVVDKHHLEGEDKTRLVVNLSRKAMGRVGLVVELEKRLDDPNLLSPTGESSDLAVPLPRVRPETVERSTGRLVVYAPESLRVNPDTTDGLRAISSAEAYEGVESTRGPRFPATRQVLAFAYTEEPAELSLAVERRKPHVTARQLLVARIETGVVKYEATFFYDILYSGVKSLRIDLPAELAGEIRNQTPGIREKTLDPPPDDLADGYIAWSLTGETEFLGSTQVKLQWEKKIEKLEIGKSVDLTIPVLKPRDVDRATGQIVLTKAETIDLHPAGEPRGLTPIDPQHDLMAGASVSDAARAFEFHEDWSLAVTATQYKLEDVKRTSIERGVVRVVATRSNQLAVQALYRMRSALQRLQIELPKSVDPARAFDTQPLRINGQTVSLERGDKGEFYVPLVGQNPDEPFLLELRYTVDGNASRLEYPVFPSEPAVQKVYLCVYVPEEQALLGSLGPWTDEFELQSTTPLSTAPLTNQSESWFVNWVREGVNITGASPDSFQTAGNLYVFSTLRPARPEEGGALRLVTLDEDWLSLLVFGAVALGGLVLIRRPASQRLMAFATLLVALVLIGVFLPTFSTQVVDGVLFLAIFLVLVVWLVMYVIRVRPLRTAVATGAAMLGALHAMPSKSTAASPRPAEPRQESPPAAASIPADAGAQSPFASESRPPDEGAPTDKPADQEGGSSHA
jgi:hypothetical protein